MASIPEDFIACGCIKVAKTVVNVKGKGKTLTVLSTSIAKDAVNSVEIFSIHRRV